MKFWKRNKNQPQENVTVVHDHLCPQNPCICLSLKLERERRLIQKMINESEKKREMAVKLLDGEANV